MKTYKSPTLNQKLASTSPNICESRHIFIIQNGDMVLMSPSADITMSGFTEIWVEDSVAHLKTGAK